MKMPQKEKPTLCNSLDYFTFIHMTSLYMAGRPSERRLDQVLLLLLLIRPEIGAGSVPARCFDGASEFRVRGREIAFVCGIIWWAFIQTIPSRLFRLSPLLPFWHRLAGSLLSSGRDCIPSPASP